jgi:hypothetical protein
MSSKAQVIIERAVVWMTATILLYLFFCPNSPAYIVLFLPPRIDIDLSFLIVPFAALLFVLLTSSIASTAIRPSQWRKIISKGLTGLAFSVFIFLFFTLAPIPAFAASTLFPLQLIVLTLTGFIVGLELLRGKRYLKPLLTALSVVILAYAIYIMGEGFSKTYEPITYASLPVAGGLLAVGAGSVLGTLKYTGKPVIMSVSERVSKGHARNLALGFLLTAYMIFIRPQVVEGFPLMVVAEWMTMALVVTAIYLRIKSSSTRLYADLESANWRKHVKEVERETGHDFEYVVSVQEQFMNQGSKEPLLIYMALLLRDLGKTEEGILKVLSPLIDYRDCKPRFFALPWMKRSIERENMNARKRVLESLFHKVRRRG